MTEPVEIGVADERGKTAIYALLDPRTCRVRYIGKTINPQRRMAAHCARTVTRRSGVSEWVRDLAADGLRPHMRVIRWVSDWEPEERRLIAIGRRKRNLLNVEDGGASQKTSAKRMSKAFIRYRVVMAKLVRWANEKERQGRIESANETRRKVAHVRRKVREMDARGAHVVEAFYAKIEAAFPA